MSHKPKTKLKVVGKAPTLGELDAKYKELNAAVERVRDEMRAHPDWPNKPAPPPDPLEMIADQIRDLAGCAEDLSGIGGVLAQFEIENQADQVNATLAGGAVKRLGARLCGELFELEKRVRKLLDDAEEAPTDRA